MTFDFTIRKEINDCQPYIQGASAADVKKKYHLKQVVKLGSNENPYGPFPAALAAMKASLNNLNRYPEDDFLEMKKLLARKNQVLPENIALGSGAGNVLETLSKTFLNTGDEVIIAKQSYRLYRELSKMMGAKVIEIPLTADYQFDLAKFATAITPKTKLIWLCNPNNPTGTLTAKKEIEKLIALLPEHVQLVVDEAYADFSDPQQLPDLIADLKAGKKVVIVRTFSKFYGLAGARLGYAIASADTIQAYNTVTEPFCTSRSALAGGYASITADQAAVQTARQRIIEQRAWLREKLAELGCPCAASQANFLFAKLPVAATEFCRSMMKNGVIVRDCTPWGYPDHIRITIGEKAENETFLQVFKVLLQRKGLVPANELVF